jgi:hypothetical protein
MFQLSPKVPQDSRCSIGKNKSLRSPVHRESQTFLLQRHDAGHLPPYRSPWEAGEAKPRFEAARVYPDAAEKHAACKLFSVSFFCCHPALVMRIYTCQAKNTGHELKYLQKRKSFMKKKISGGYEHGHEHE